MIAELNERLTNTADGEGDDRDFDPSPAALAYDRPGGPRMLRATVEGGGIPCKVAAAYVVPPTSCEASAHLVPPVRPRSWFQTR